MSKFTHTLLGVASMFTMNTALTSCNQPIKEAQVLGVTYKTNPDQRRMSKINDTLLFKIDTAKTADGNHTPVTDTMLVIRNNGYDEAQYSEGHYVAICKDKRFDTTPAHIMVADRKYNFKDTADYKEMKRQLMEANAFQGTPNPRHFKVENKLTRR